MKKHRLSLNSKNQMRSNVFLPKLVKRLKPQTLCPLCRLVALSNKAPSGLARSSTATTEGRNPLLPLSLTTSPNTIHPQPPPTAVPRRKHYRGPMVALNLR